jgi:hypothetical protein
LPSRVQCAILIFLKLEWPSCVEVPSLLVLPEIFLEAQAALVKICSSSSQSQRKTSKPLGETTGINICR